ncbi:hypothetical protein ASD99_21965 [Mesorhizobium sp. Root695]|nr:hypothetical protein ASD12_26765 [Mesorhizobium sp. Root102]KRB30562.1 hypothetical protein ASD99_21965 [Mesorhizobium sp. Root695]
MDATWKGPILTALDESYELIGRILAKLVLGGLRSQEIEARDVMPQEAAIEGGSQHFLAATHWLRLEGLITAGGIYSDGRAWGVQLTSKGVAAIEKGTFNGPKASIRETVESKPDGSLGPDTYGKIGSFVGGLLGGFTQSAS